MFALCFICRRETERKKNCPNCKTIYCLSCLTSYELNITDKHFECLHCALLYASPLSLVVRELAPAVVERAAAQGRSTSMLTIAEFAVGEFDAVEVRCLKLDSRGTAVFGEQTWPDAFRLACAGSGYVLTEGAALKPTLSLKKRKDNCYAISAATFAKIVERSGGGARCLYLDYDTVYDERNSLARDAGRICYALCVVGVRRLTLEAMLASPLVCELSGEAAHSFFESLLSAQSEEVAVAGLRLDVMCKITLTRPELPVRGNNCRHISCFSLKSFFFAVSASEHKKVYCPICQRSIQWYFLDRSVEEAIRNAPPNEESVLLGGDAGDTKARVRPAQRSLIVMELTESESETQRDAESDAFLASLEDSFEFQQTLNAAFCMLAQFCLGDGAAAETAEIAH